MVGELVASGQYMDTMSAIYLRHGCADLGFGDRRLKPVELVDYTIGPITDSRAYGLFETRAFAGTVDFQWAIRTHPECKVVPNPVVEPDPIPAETSNRQSYVRLQSMRSTPDGSRHDIEVESCTVPVQPGEQMIYPMGGYLIAPLSGEVIFNLNERTPPECITTSPYPAEYWN